MRRTRFAFNLFSESARWVEVCKRQSELPPLSTFNTGRVLPLQSRWAAQFCFNVIVQFRWNSGLL